MDRKSNYYNIPVSKETHAQLKLIGAIRGEKFEDTVIFMMAKCFGVDQDSTKSEVAKAVVDKGS